MPKQRQHFVLYCDENYPRQNAALVFLKRLGEVTMVGPRTLDTLADVMLGETDTVLVLGLPNNNNKQRVARQLASIVQQNRVHGHRIYSLLGDGIWTFRDIVGAYDDRSNSAYGYLSLGTSHPASALFLLHDLTIDKVVKDDEWDPEDYTAPSPKQYGPGGVNAPPLPHKGLSFAAVWYYRLRR